ncbi:hypothetical protein [Kallotenue papyrolyticum]|uniref:hypothetical protein n=1 Tax=Kallotenue papyrolyticum TaxID=1325125 RepID=UPI00047865CA|nr:hypothetical protein [Kallotenue papyrolyticum]
MSDLCLGDLVRINEAGKLHSVVQVDDFYGEDNLALAQSYIFTGRSVGKKKASAELLSLFCDAYLNPRLENRFVVIATYGHGKSHFALAIANYFGRPLDAPEGMAILEGLQKALDGDAGLFGRLKDFKEHNQPYLVLILRGDDPYDLSTMLFRALDRALKHHPATRDLQSPFWSHQALRFLDSLDDSRHRQADEFLQAERLDLATLRRQIKHHESRALVVFQRLFSALNGGMPPNFEQGISIGETIDWIIRELCQARNLFGGLLILFDEFSAFVQRYPDMARPFSSQPLQELLESVERYRGRAELIAFAQHDPTTLARELRRRDLASSTLDAIDKELTRFPREQRYLLHSPLEAVLDAYIIQDQARWQKLYEQLSFKNQLLNHAYNTFLLFQNHYQEQLGWDIEHFRQSVAQGCFPLHPLTTTLLATVELHQTSNPRTVLGFVREALNARRDQPVMCNGAVNWIVPIELVDHFEAMLGPEYEDLYLPTYRNIGGSDAKPEQVRVIKALLLRTLADIRTSGTEVSFNTLIAMLAGLPTEQADETLRQLAHLGRIRSNESEGTYSLWPYGQDATAVERLVRDKARQLPNTWETFKEINRRLGEEKLLNKVPVSVEWGHTDAWAAHQIIAPFGLLSLDWLRTLAQDYLQPASDGETRRGLVVWLLPEEEELIDDRRSAVRARLREAFGERDLPLVIAWPRQAMPLLRYARMWQAAATLSHEEREKFSKDQYQTACTKIHEELKRGLERLASNAALAYSGGMLPEHLSATARLDSVLPQVYEAVYAYAPKPFFTQYQERRLYDPVARVCEQLIRGQVSLDALAANEKGPSRDLVIKFLKQAWGLLAEGDLLREPPEGSPLRPGWNRLDQTFRPDNVRVAVKPVVQELLQAPFGYDANTLALLFCAWYGYNRSEVQFFSQNTSTPVAPEAVFRQAKRSKTDEFKTPKDLLKTLLTLSLQRRSRSEAEQQIRSLLQRIEQGAPAFASSMVKETLLQLRQAFDNPHLPQDLKDRLPASIDRLEQDYRHYQHYDETLRTIQQLVPERTELERLRDHWGELRSLQPPTLILTGPASLESVRQELRRKIEAKVTNELQRLVQLDDPSNYTHQRQRISTIGSLLTEAGIDSFKEHVRQSLAKLDKRKKEIEQRRQDQQALQQLRMLPERAPLSDLERALQIIDGLTIVSDEAQRERDTKRQRIAAMCDRLRALPMQAEQQLIQARRVAEVERVRDELLTHLSWLEGEPLQAAQQVLARCTTLAALLQTVEQRATRPWQTYEEAQSVRADLAALLARDDAVLAPAQREEVEQTLRQLDERIQKRRDEAHAWLERCLERERHREAAATLLDEVERATGLRSFLSPQDQQRCEELGERLRQRLDQDQVERVIGEFQKISSLQQRRVCLQRLVQIVKGEYEGATPHAG